MPGQAERGTGNAASHLKEKNGAGGPCYSDAALRRSIFIFQLGGIFLYKNRRNICLLYGAALLQGMVFYAPVATLYRQAHGVSVFQITLIESVSLALMLLLEVPWGAAADRIGYRRTLLLANALYLLSKLIFWRADGFGMFLLERVVLAASLAGVSGCDAALLWRSAGGRNGARVFGRYDAMMTIGLLAASTAFSFFWAEDYAAAALATGVSAAGALLLTGFLADVPESGEEEEQRDARASARETFSALRRMAQDRRFLSFLIGSALLAETNQTVTVFLSQLQYVKSGIPVQSMGCLYTALTLAGIFGAWASARCAAHLGTARLGKALFFTAGAACALMAAFARPVLSAACILILRLCAAMFAPAAMEVKNAAVQGSARATALSVFSMAANAVAIVTNLAFGRLSDRGVAYAMAFGALLCAAGGMMTRGQLARANAPGGRSVRG